MQFLKIETDIEIETIDVSVKLQEGNGIKFHIVEKKTSPY